MANERKIVYNIQAVDQTDKAFNDVEKNADKSFKSVDKSVEKTSSMIEKLGKDMKDAFGREVRSSTNDLKKAIIGVFTAPIRLATAGIKLFTKWVITAKLIELAIKGIDGASGALAKRGIKAFNIFGLKLDVSEKTATRLKAGIASLNSTMARVAKGASTAGKGIDNAFGASAQKAINAFALGFQSVGLETRLKRAGRLFDNAAVSSGTFIKALHTDKLRENYERLDKTSTAIGQFKLRMRDATGASARWQNALFKSGQGLGKLGRIIPKAKTAIKDFGSASDKAARGLGHVGKGFSFVMKHSKLLIGGLAALAAGVVALTLSWKTLMSTIAQGDILDKHSRRIGFTVAEYAKWDFMLKRSGSSMMLMETAIAGFSKRLMDAARGTGEARVALDALGISALTSDGYLRNNNEVFEETITKLSKMENKATRNAFAVSIFGMEARSIVPLLDEFAGKTESVTKQFEEYRPTLERAAAASALFKDNQLDISNAWDVAKASLFTGTIERLNDTFTLIKNSQIGDVLFGIAKSVMWLVNWILDLFNTIVGVITSTFSTLTSGFKNLVWVVASGYTKLLEMINSNPIGDKLISDKHISDMKKKVSVLEKISKDGTDRMVESWKQTGKSFIQFATLGFKRFIPDAVEQQTGPGAKVPTGETKGTTKTVKGFGGPSMDLSALANFNRERLALLDEFANLSIMNMKNRFDREEALAKVAYDKKKNKIYEAETFGLLTEQEIAEARLQAAKEFNNKMSQIEKDRLSNTMSFLKTTNDKFKEVFTNTGNETVDALGSSFSNLNDIAANTFTQMMDKGLEFKDVMASVSESTISFNNALGQVASIRSAERIENMNKEKEALKEQFESDKQALTKRRISQRKFNSELLKLEAKKAKKEAEILKKQEEEKRKAARANLVIQLISAIANTATGVSAALALGPPQGIVLAAITGALGAVSVGIIASQLAKFAEGGIVDGNKTTGDQNIVRVNSGEMIINKQQQRNLLDMATRGGGGSGEITVNVGDTIIQGNADMNTVSALNESRNKQVNMFREVLEDMNRTGALKPIVQNAL